MADIQVATFEQLTTILTKLATNYSNIFIDYFNLFYNPNPMDVTVQIYDEAGVLQTYTIPNRAKDRNFILNGNGSPEGVVAAAKGTTYQDLENGSLYIKITGSDVNNWSRILSSEELETVLTRGSGSPEGLVVRPKGAIFIDEENAAIYIKTTASGSIGWQLATANPNILASINLDNLSEDGERHFANPSLSNLDAIGSGIINSKEDVENKVTTLNSSSTDTQYPSAKATYDLVSGTTSPLANRNLDNLTTIGEEHFLGKPQVSDCVLHAPSGVPSVSGNVVNVPVNMILLAPNGRDSNKSLINDRIITLNRTASISGNNYNGFVFYNATNSSVLIAREEGLFSQETEPVASVYPSVWYNEPQNLYKVKSSSESSWTTTKLTEVASFTIDSESAITRFNGYSPIKLASNDNLKNVKIELSKKLSDLEEETDTKFSQVQAEISPIETRIHITGTYINGTSGYNIWSNGYCEQWGYTANESATTVVFLKKFKDVNYYINFLSNAGHSSNPRDYFRDKTKINCVIGTYTASNKMWRACGYLAEGEYPTTGGG